jgi:hypothetical protein
MRMDLGADADDGKANPNPILQRSRDGGGGECRNGKGMMKLGGTYCKPNLVNSDLEMCAHRWVGEA